MFVRRSASAAIALGLLVIATSTPVATAQSKVGGRVMVGGQPFAAAKITLHRADGQFYGSMIKDGRYVMDFVPAGRMKITVEGKGVPGRFASAETSPLVFELRDSTNQFDIELK